MGHKLESNLERKADAREFDARLEGRTSKLVDYSSRAPEVIAEAYHADLHGGFPLLRRKVWQDFPKTARRI